MGFTLVELLTGLALVGIGTAASMPMINSYREAQRTRGAVMQVQLALNIAKNRAAAMNQVVRVDFAPGALTTAAGFFTAYVDLNRDGTLDAGEIEAAALPNTVKRSGMLGYELPIGISFDQPNGASTGPYGMATTSDGVTFTNNAFSIFPDGTIGEAGHVAIRDQTDRSYAIALTAGGSTRAFYFDGSEWK